MAATHDDLKDAARYRWLKLNCIRVVPASREGPEFPLLEFYWGLFDWYKTKTTPKEMIDEEIDKRMDQGT